MKYLISTVETYRVDTEEEAKVIIEEAKQNDNFILTKYTCDLKEVKETKKSEGYSFWKVTLTKQFNDIKDPMLQTTVEYEVHYDGTF